MDGNSERDIELIDLIEIFLKYKWLILVATLAAMAGEWGLAQRPRPTLYEAQNILMVKHPRVNPIVNQMNLHALLPPLLSMELYQSLALADDLRLELIETLELEQSLADLDGMMHAEIGGQNSLVLTVKSPDPAVPVPVVNAWAERFVERNQGLTAEALGNRYEWVFNQYEVARTNLEAGEDSLGLFELHNPVGFLELQQTLFDSSYRQLQGELHTLRLQFQRDSTDLELQQEVVAAIERENSFVFQAFPDSGVAASAMPSGTALSWEQMERVRMTRLAFDQEYQLAQGKLVQAMREDSIRFTKQQQLDSLQFDQQQRLALRRFAAEHPFHELEQELEELTRQAQDYQQQIIHNPEGEFFPQEMRIKVLEEERNRHKPTPQGSDELNPIYLSLGQQLADQRVAYQTARAMGEGGRRQVEQLRARREGVSERYHAAQLKRVEFEREVALLQARFAHQAALAREQFEREAVQERAEFEREYEQTRSNIDRSLEVMQQVYDDSRQVDWERYMGAKSAIIALGPAVRRSQRRIGILAVEQIQMQRQLKALQDEIAFLRLQRERLGRNQQVYRETFASLSKLVEETRIDREKAAGDIQLLTHAIAPRVKRDDAPPQKTMIAGAVGFLLSTLWAMLREYVRKARARREQEA